MNKVCSFLFCLSMTLAVHIHGQDITGDWYGALHIQGTQLRLVFHIKKTDSGYVSTMDSPDQKALGLPVAKTSYVQPRLNISMPAIHLEYEGELDQEQKIKGSFKQNGQTFPLELSHEQIEKKVVKHPQEPIKPYPYSEEEVQFENPIGHHTLAGTLTLPQKTGIFPVVILITGSGPQNRDEELLGHKPFLVLSDHLTRQGIGVLRYDDRGTAKSTGDFKSATTADLATDVEAAINFLMTRPEVDKKKIGLIGHSEGGLIAPIVAAGNRNVSYIVLMAGTGIPGDELLLKQEELIARATGSKEDDISKMKVSNRKAFDMINTIKDTSNLRRSLTEYVMGELKASPSDQKPAGMTDEAYAKIQVQTLTSPWMLYFLRYDPRPVISKVKCPVLAINGAKDLQVPPRENLEEIEKALRKGGNKKVTTQQIPNLNHLFQECTTGSPEEYATIEQTISPVALNIISDWIKDRVK